MSTMLAKFEKNAFRRLNSVVEPAVRRGIGSLTLAPATLIVLETLGFKSGKQRRTPLWSFRLGRYRIVSTARGDRSFWVKNLLKEPKVSYYLGGKRRESNAFVITSNMLQQHSVQLPPILQQLAKTFFRNTRSGWTFAVLIPIKQ